jgi:hypothetical protein
MKKQQTSTQPTTTNTYHQNLEKLVESMLFEKKKDQKEVVSKSVLEFLLLHDHERFGLHSGRFWKYQIDNNGVQSIGFLAARPNATYTLGTGVYAAGGGKSCITALSNQKFRLGSDAGRDLIFGQYTNYHKTIIHTNKNIIITQDILPRSYDGGNGHEMWDPLDADNDVDDYYRGIMKASIFVLAVPIGYKPKRFYIDITGKHHQNMMSNHVDPDELHYPSADIYKAAWRWQTTDINPLNKSFFYDESQHNPKFNTLVFQGHTWEYEYLPGMGAGSFSRVTQERGHWGNRVYEGCGAVRRGKKKMLEIPSFIGTKTISLGH